jgi:hypothetical protein
MEVAMRLLANKLAESGTQERIGLQIVRSRLTSVKTLLTL